MERTATKIDSLKVEECLSGNAIHHSWMAAYRSGQNEAFFSLAFDYIARTLRAPKGSLILDAGCGTGDHAIRLADRGFTVQGVDISETAVSLARDAVRKRGMSDRISVRQANLRSLPFDDGRFPYVLCWGVLMHIPEIEKALAELARVLARGGLLVLGENNVRSIQSLAMDALMRMMRKNKGNRKRTMAGLEEWQRTDEGMLVTRDTDIGWLVRHAKRNGLALKHRTAGQASNLYAWLSSTTLKKIIHAFNILWFNYIRIPQPAFGNILIFRKTSR